MSDEVANDHILPNLQGIRQRGGLDSVEYDTSFDDIHYDIYDFTTLFQFLDTLIL